MSGGYTALGRARSLVEIGRHDEARRTLGPALLNPDTSREAHCLVALCHLNTNRLQDAQNSAEQAIAIDPSHEWGHRLRAISHMRRGHRRKALADAETAARLAPHVPETLNVLALTQYNAFKRSDSDVTVAALLREHPHTVLAHETAAEIATLRRRWSVAEMHLRSALHLDPHDENLTRCLGDVLRAQGRRNEAAQAYLASASINPTSSETRKKLARLGLPALGGSLLLLKIGGYVAARATLQIDPVAAFVVAVIGFAVAIGFTTKRRLDGTRSLPEHLRRGMRGDHVDAALRWVFWFGVVSLVLAALAVSSENNEQIAAGVFLACGLVAIAASRAFRTRPPRKLFSRSRR